MIEEIPSSRSKVVYCACNYQNKDYDKYRNVNFQMLIADKPFWKLHKIAIMIEWSYAPFEEEMCKI